MKYVAGCNAEVVSERRAQLLKVATDLVDKLQSDLREACACACNVCDNKFVAAVGKTDPVAAGVTPFERAGGQEPPRVSGDDYIRKHGRIVNEPIRTFPAVTSGVVEEQAINTRTIGAFE